jgi:hypothetical protein
MPSFSLFIIWLLVSLAFVFSLTYFTIRLLDPFYPTVVSLTPGFLLSMTTIFLILSITFILLYRFGLFCHFLLNLTPIFEVTSTFLCIVFGLTFSIVYGSTFSKTSQIRMLTSTSITACKFNPSFCDSLSLDRYISLRTVQPGSVVTFGLFFWLLIHSVMIYVVFDDTLITQGGMSLEELPQSPTSITVPMVPEDETLE